jgi:hypothetical protein
VIRFWCARFIQKLVNEAARCVFYYLTCVIHYDGFVGFKCVLENNVSLRMFNLYKVVISWFSIILVLRDADY